MRETQIVKHTQMRKEKLNPYQYTISLLQEGFRARLIDRQTMYRIQEQMMLILKDLIVRYTKGESSSVKTETAESLLNSVYYSIDAYLSSLKDPEAGLAALKPEKVRETYEKGIETVNECLKEAMLLCQWVLKHKLNVPLEVYKSSIEEAIPEFFRHYNVIFGAHDRICLWDYPLVFDDWNVRGVFYIRNYMQNLKTETLFCMLFPEGDICKLLEVYGRTCRIKYKEAPFNLFEVVVNNSIFSVLSGSNAGNLTVSDSQYRIIRERLNGMEALEIRSEIDEAVGTVIEDLNIEQSGLTEYIRRYTDVLMPRLLNAIANDSLHNIVMVAYEEENKSDRLMLEVEGRMSDKAFKVLVGRICRCADMQSKIDIIRSKVRSIEDFGDVLSADCLFGEEYSALYKVLSDTELAILGKMLLLDRTGEDIRELQAVLGDEDEMAYEWQQQYIKFMQGMNKTRGKIVQEIFNGL